jgi:8-oxo-dGTP diphosphatase
MKLKQGIGIIIQNEKGEFLLHLRDEKTSVLTNQWCLIGGSVEENETPELAAIREVKEETNLDAKELKLFKNFIFQEKEISIFTAKVNTKDQQIKLGEGKKI